MLQSVQMFSLRKQLKGPEDKRRLSDFEKGSDFHSVLISKSSFCGSLIFSLIENSTSTDLT